jgi:D-alanyl-lipoteichoic acid acyltransferase DltB (MBOAT superfamily)
MLFNSVIFWIFFPVVTAAYFLLPQSLRWRMLLVASYLFYGWWDVRFLVLILLSTTMDFAAGLGMTGEKLSWRARLGLSSVLALGGLVFLGPNWPAVQADARNISWESLFELFAWRNSAGSMAAILGIAIAGPILYELYFLVDAHRRRKLFLITSIVVNLGLLGFFKYFNFFADSALGIGRMLGLSEGLGSERLLQIVLPVGISFYTFQTMSYTIDVYRNQCPIERSYGKFALYLSLYPQLVAGPIERAKHLLPQLSEHTRWDWGRVALGLRTMGWGLFKKVCIADRLAVYVDAVYSDPQAGHSGPTLLLATYLFAFQIYCDFSGYTDIARGAAKVMGFDLMENFRRPYFATTITEFWRRWHISLSTWLRDYLYIPLGGNRKGEARTYVNLMITMLLGGLWHGASWNFVVWGGLQGVMLAASKATLPARDRLVARLGLPRPVVFAVRMLVTFHLVCLSWVFFRAHTLPDAWHVVTHVWRDWPALMVNPGVTIYCALFVAVLLFAQTLAERHRGPGEVIDRAPMWVRWAVALAVLMCIPLFGVDGGSQFIYFTF